ncbi:MAG: glycosyl hydrolase [Chitinophagaceae bacterium]
MKIKLIQFSKVVVILSVSVLLLTHSTSHLSISGKQLEDNFIHPPLESRPLAFWDWLNGYVDTAKMVHELEEMSDKGMQGAFVWDIGALSDPGKLIPAGPAFLDNKSLGYISLALKTAKRVNLNLGLFASSSWNAGGPWMAPEDASKELLSSKQVVTGASRQKITIGEPESKKGKSKIFSLITSIAIPHSNKNEIDYASNKPILLDKYTLGDKYIDWVVPVGKWDIISFFMCNTGQNLEVPSPNSSGLIIDHLSKRATKIYFDSILAKLAKGIPDNQFKYFELDSYEVWPAKDWTPGLVIEFKKRYGYDPKPFLPLLLGYNCKDSILGKRFMEDYGRLVSDFIIENHYTQSVDRANKNGIKMFIEAGHGGYARVDPLKALGKADMPMGEFWNRKQHWVTKEAASAAHIYGKKIVAAESLTGWQNWQHGPADFKQLIDVAFCEGLNQVVFHTFAHNPGIAGKPGFAYHAGEHFNVNTTWWSMVRPFMDYISRCSYLLRQGNFVGDVCLYYGDEAPNLVPPDRIDPNIAPLYDDNHCLHCGQLKTVNPGKLPGYDYDYMNAEIITKQLKVENGRLVLPSGQNYRMMQIPERDKISVEVLKKLDTLVNNGAIIIGPKPQIASGLKNYPDCDSEVKAIAGKMWGNCDGKKILSNKYGKGKIYWGKTAMQVLAELQIAPDMDVIGIDNADGHIDYLHRQTNTEEIYFVSNSKLKKEKVTCIFRVDKNMVPALWDAATGQVQHNVKYVKVEKGISIDFVMDPVGSRFVVFTRKPGVKHGNGVDVSYDLQYGFTGNIKSEEKNKMIDISYNWKIHFDTSMGGPASYHLDSLVSWTEIAENGIIYYSGTATYEKDFIVNGSELSQGTKSFVVFEDIQEIAKVFINGKDCGIIWTLPYNADITKYLKEGKNHISVQVINTWNNRVVGDVRTPDKKQFTRTNIKYKFTANSPLLKSGITGKANIIFRDN